MVEKYALATYLGPGKWTFMFDLKFRRGFRAPWKLTEEQGKKLEEVTMVGPNGGKIHLFEVEWHSGKEIQAVVEADGVLNFLNVKEHSILAKLCEERGISVKATDSVRYLRGALKEFAKSRPDSEVEQLKSDLEGLQHPSRLKKLKDKAKNVIKGAKSRKPKVSKKAKK